MAEEKTGAAAVETVEELAERIPNLKEDLCDALQQTIIEVLMTKLKRAAKDLVISQVAVAGGVSANSGLREAFLDYGRRYRWQVYIPPFSFTTDNAFNSQYFCLVDISFSVSAPIYT